MNPWIPIVLSVVTSLVLAAVSWGKFTEALKNLTHIVEKAIEKQDAHDAENAVCSKDRGILTTRIEKISDDVEGLLDRERNRHPNGAGG